MLAGAKGGRASEMALDGEQVGCLPCPEERPFMFWGTCSCFRVKWGDGGKVVSKHQNHIAGMPSMVGCHYEDREATGGF